MAGELYPVAGCRIYLGLSAALKTTDFVLADFPAVTDVSWLEIDGWTQMGAFGDTGALITTALINRGRDVKQKGTANAGSMANVFAAVPGDAGQARLKQASKPSNKKNYQVRIDLNDAPETESVVTISIATPGVVSWAANGLANGNKVVLQTTGALPTGLSPGVEYYVVAVAAGTFQLALTPGGAAIATTGTQSGVHTAVATKNPTRVYFMALAMNAQQQGGEANTIRNINTTLEINSNIVESAAA
jgi:hypothetical protein